MTAAHASSSAFDMPSSLFEKAEKRERDKYEKILKMSGPENPYRIHQELGQTMLLDCTIERHNDKLAKVLAKIEELTDRANAVGVTDTSTHANQGAQFVRHLQNMLTLARVIAQGAKNRDESRGAHYKPAFPTRNDEEWQRTTLASHEADGGVKFVRSFDYVNAGKTIAVDDHVDVSLIRPRARTYDKVAPAPRPKPGSPGGADAEEAPKPEKKKKGEKKDAEAG